MPDFLTFPKVASVVLEKALYGDPFFPISKTGNQNQFTLAISTLTRKSVTNNTVHTTKMTQNNTSTSFLFSFL